MSKGEVQKGYPCIWQIHYHLVFPVKYRKALLDKMVTKIIEETAEGIPERYAIEMEALGNDLWFKIKCRRFRCLSSGDFRFIKNLD